MFTDWHPLGVVLYRKWHVYDMVWDDKIKLENFLVCGAPFGGPVAMTLETKKGVNPELESYKNKIFIKTSSGNRISEIDWDDKPIMGMGWSDIEHLVTFLENGHVKIFDIHGKLIHHFPLLEIAGTQNGFIECHFWGNGIAAMTNDFNIMVVEGLATPDASSFNKGHRIYSLRTKLNQERSFTCMAIIPPLQSNSGMLEVLVGTSDCSVLVIKESADQEDIDDQFLQTKLEAPISKIAIAPNVRYLACYRKDGVLTVMGSNFSTKVLDFDTKSISKPIEIVWCGEDAVVMQWRNTGIVMVGPYGDWLNFPYDVAVHLVPERDCCRIITSTGCEILQRVPDCTVAIRSVGSTDPAALMFDAMEAFEEGDPKSDENIRSIAASNQLGDAVHACILAAAAEFDVGRQQSLLKAASYGKAFCPDANPSEFVETAQKLRVLNEVRKPHVGLPLTLQQYNQLTPEVLVGRLTMRNHHFLAMRVCELLKLKNERVLVHWAVEKVKRMGNSSVDEIDRVIKKQLEPYGRVSYLAIAEAAFNYRNNLLATKLLDKQQNPDDQIPLLLKMNEEELALQKAINSEDTDLIYYTLIALEARILSSSNRSNIDALYRTIHNHLEAANLMKIYYRNKVNPNDRTALNNLLMYSKNYFEAGIAAVNQAYMQTSADRKAHLLREATGMFGNGGKDNGFYKGMVDDQLELLEVHRTLTSRLTSRRDFTGKDVMETIQELIMISLSDQSDARNIEAEVARIVKKFKVGDKALWYVKIHCFSTRGAWEQLMKLAIERKSPVGYKPFAVACMKAGKMSEAEGYAERITVNEDKFDLFVEMKSWRKAAEVAQKLRDPYRLQEILRVCQDSETQRYVQDIISKL